MAKQITPTNFPTVSHIDAPKILGELIRAKRTLLNLRLEDFAALCSVGINTLSRIENGNENCTLGATFKVLNGLGIRLSFDENLSNNKDKNTSATGSSLDESWV